MAVPVRVQSNAGNAITATSGSVSLTGCTQGNVIIVQMLQDGTAASETPTNITNIEGLAGLANTLDAITGASTFTNVGSPTAARQFLRIGRVMANGTVSLTVNSSGGDDFYVQIHEFSGVHTGTSLSDVIENGSAGSIGTDSVGTSTTVADSNVTTLGADRLACNLGAINDDLTGIASFAGETGGDWTMVASFESATGTDGTVFLQTASMASAGTIGGGSDTITSDGWGVRGFALIPAAVVELPPTRDSQHLMQAVNTATSW